MTDAKITPEIATHKHLRGQASNDQAGNTTTEGFQTNQPSWIIPGFNAPPSRDWANQSNYLPDTSFLPNSGNEIIPTLLPGKTANQADQTTYPINSATAQLTEQNRNSIVQVYGHDQGQARDEDLAGSGFFIDTQGDLVTAYHVVSGIDGPIDVSTADGIVHQARVLGTDPKSDLAILSIDTYDNTQPVSFNTNIAALKKGDPLIAVGHPQGWTDLYISPGQFDGTTKLGNLAAPADLQGANPNQPMIAADMNTQQGDSGAPVFNAAGQVVGLVDRGDNGSHGYMVPASAIIALATGQPDSSTALTTDTTSASDPDTTTNPGGTNSFARPKDTVYYGIGAGLTAGSRLLSNSSALKGFAGSLGIGLSGIVGFQDLTNHDAKAMYNAFENGSDRAKLRSTLSVAADGLLVGAVVANYIPGLRPASVGISLAGSALKIGNRVIHT